MVPCWVRFSNQTVQLVPCCVRLSTLSTQIYMYTHIIKFSNQTRTIKPFGSCLNPIYKDIHVHCTHTPARTHKHINAREFVRIWRSVTLCWDRGSRGSGGRRRGGWDEVARGDWREAKTAWEWRRKGTTMWKSLWWKKQRTGGGAWATWVRWWSSISPLSFALFCGSIGASNLIRTLDCGRRKRERGVGFYLRKNPSSSSPKPIAQANGFPNRFNRSVEATPFLPSGIRHETAN